MEIESLKFDFYNYIKDQKTTHTGVNTSDENFEDFSAFSVYKYAKEFKDFLSDNFQMSSDVITSDINELLKLEIKNGQLIDPNETEGTEEAQSGDIQQEEPTSTEAAVNNDVDADSNAQSELSQTEENKENPSMIDVLNMLFADDEFKAKYDTDGEEGIDNEEFEAFLESIKSLDGDAENISIDDIVKSLDTPANTETPQEEPAANDAPAQQASSSPSGSSGSGYTPSSTSSQTPKKSEDTQEEGLKSLEGLNSQELTEELSNAQDTLQEKQGELSSILDGSNSDLVEFKKNIETNYKAYTDELEKTEDENAQQLLDLTNQLKAFEDEKHTYEEDKQNNEAQISVERENVKAQTQIISNCDSMISSLSAQAASLQASLYYQGDDEESENNKAAIQAQITEIEAKIAEYEEQKAAAETSKSDSQANISTLTNRNKENDALITKNDQAIENLNGQISELEKTVFESNSNLAQLKENYENSKEDYEELKAGILEAVQKQVISAQERVVEVNNALEAAIKEESKIEESEEGNEFLEELSAFETADETGETADKTEGVDDESEKTDEESEDKDKENSKIDDLCEMLNMDRNEIGLYLKYVSDKSDLDVSEMYQEISSYVDSAKNETEQEEAENLIEKYNLDEDKVSAYVDEYNTSYGTNYTVESFIDNPVKLFEVRACFKIENPAEVTPAPQPGPPPAPTPTPEPTTGSTQSDAEGTEQNQEPQPVPATTTPPVSQQSVIDETLGKNSDKSYEEQIEFLTSMHEEDPAALEEYFSNDKNSFFLRTTETLLNDSNYTLEDVLTFKSTYEKLAGEDNIEKLHQNKEYAKNVTAMFKKAQTDEDMQMLEENGITKGVVGAMIQMAYSGSEETAELKSMMNKYFPPQEEDFSDISAQDLLLQTYGNKTIPQLLTEVQNSNISEKEARFILNEKYDSMTGVVDTFRAQYGSNKTEQEAGLQTLIQIYDTENETTQPQEDKESDELVQEFFDNYELNERINSSEYKDVQFELISNALGENSDKTTDEKFSFLAAISEKDSDLVSEYFSVTENAENFFKQGISEIVDIQCACEYTTSVADAIGEENFAALKKSETFINSAINLYNRAENTEEINFLNDNGFSLAELNTAIGKNTEKRSELLDAIVHVHPEYLNPNINNPEATNLYEAFGLSEMQAEALFDKYCSSECSGILDAFNSGELEANTTMYLLLQLTSTRQNGGNFFAESGLSNNPSYDILSELGKKDYFDTLIKLYNQDIDISDSSSLKIDINASQGFEAEGIFNGSLDANSTAAQVLEQFMQLNSIGKENFSYYQDAYELLDNYVSSEHSIEDEMKLYNFIYSVDSELITTYVNSIGRYERLSDDIMIDILENENYTVEDIVGYKTLLYNIADWSNDIIDNPDFAISLYKKAAQEGKTEYLNEHRFSAELVGRSIQDKYWLGTETDKLITLMNSIVYDNETGSQKTETYDSVSDKDALSEKYKKTKITNILLDLEAGKINEQEAKYILEAKYGDMTSIVYAFRNENCNQKKGLELLINLYI